MTLRQTRQLDSSQRNPPSPLPVEPPRAASTSTSKRSTRQLSAQTAIEQVSICFVREIHRTSSPKQTTQCNDRKLQNVSFFNGNLNLRFTNVIFHVKLCVFFELQDVSKIQMFATECESKTHLISSDSMANSCSPSLLSPVIPCIQLRLIQTFQTFEWICCNRFCASHHQGKQNGQNDMGTMWCYHQYYINYINIAKTMSRHV